MLLTILGRGRWLALVLGLYLACETKLYAQFPPPPPLGPIQLRGPTIGNRQPRLPPRPPINLLNNGSLQTSPNPNAILPNQHQFAYIAAMPLGDRLGYNGIFYDYEIIPNIGLYSPGAMGGGGGGVPPGGGGPFPPPFPGPVPFPPVKAAMLQRQRMMAMQMQQMNMQMQMMAMQAYMYQYQQAGMNQGYGNQPGQPGAANSGSPGTLQTFGAQAPINTVGFGAGFRN